MSEMGLAITYAQMVAMGKEKLVYLMLNLKSHFLAIETCKLLKLSSETLSQIFIDWAIAAIDKDRGEQQDELADRIYDRFNQLQAEKDMKINDIALTEIAHEAAKKDKKVLAKKLLEKETSITRKIPVLVWMKEYESSLEEAFHGKDTNLINLVLIKFFGLASPKEISSLYQRVLSTSPELIVQLVNFLKRTNRKAYLNEFFDMGRNSETAMLEQLNASSEALNTYPESERVTAESLLKEKFEFLQRCRLQAENMKDKELSALIANEMRLIEYHLGMKKPTAASVPIDKFHVNSC